jgi:hypothetical protein
MLLVGERKGIVVGSPYDLVTQRCMMMITRFCGNAAVLWCTLLLQNCQSGSLRVAGEEKRQAVDSSSMLEIYQGASNRTPEQSLTLSAPVSPLHYETSSSSEMSSNNGQGRFTARCDPPAVVVPRDSHAVLPDQGENQRRMAPPMAFGAKEWERYFGKVEPAPDLPSDMAIILDSVCPFWKDRKVRDTHLLVLIPAKVNGQPFSLNLLRDLIQRSNDGGHRTRYQWYDSNVEAQIGAASPEASYWLLMTREILQKSSNKFFTTHEKSVARYRKQGYDGLPTALDAATAILTHYVRSKERLYSDSPRTYTYCRCHCREEASVYHIIVGCFDPSGLRLNHGGSIGRNECGVALCRKFCEAEDSKPAAVDLKEAPNERMGFLECLFSLTRYDDRRQWALEGLRREAQERPHMFCECLPSLGAAAEEGNEEVRLFALKTLGEVAWRRYFGEVEPAPDLPAEMVAILDSVCLFWPEKQVKDTHLLALIPARVNGRPFSLDLLGELIERPQNGGHKTQYRYDSNERNRLGQYLPKNPIGC